jgi:hypothetical protein
VARSETNPIAGKVTYTDLNLTNYPDDIDTRGNNLNMLGYQNLKDYNYAEHINALEDAVMALQRSLGITPYIDKDSVDRTTVSARIAIIENKNYDARYGGTGWVTSQTLVGHTHNGATGHPSQVNLIGEVQGILPKANVDLSISTGITGGDVAVSSTDSRKISVAINDKLSVTAGGTIQAKLEIKNSFNSRVFKEWDATSATAGSLTTDTTTLIGQSIRGAGTTAFQFFTPNVNNLLYGQYVMSVRARVSSLVSEEVLHLRWYDSLAGTWQLNSSLYLKGTDFLAINTWQMFYLTFNHASDQTTNPYSIMNVWKPLTTANINVDVDSVIIMPTHPAIYDR